MLEGFDLEDRLIADFAACEENSLGHFTNEVENCMYIMPTDVNLDCSVFTINAYEHGVPNRAFN